VLFDVSLKMKTTILSFIFVATNIFGMDADDINNLAKEPHNRENIIKPLEIYPDAREYKIKVRSGSTADALEAITELVAKEKVVQGRYIVSEAMLPGADKPLIMVVEYEAKTDTFKKWVLLSNGIVGSSTGVANLNTRTIAWASDKAHDEIPTTVTIESHSNNKSEWKETFMQGGKIMSVSHGEATKTK
jgi:hypothetical protein